MEAKQLRGDTGVVQPEPDVLERERARPRSRWTWVALVLLLVVTGAAWVVDEHRRASEHAALSVCRDRLLAADQGATVRLSRTADYLRPSLAGLPEARVRRLAQLMRSPAGLARPAVADALRTCREVGVWSWHGPDRASRASAIAYGEALLARLGAIARDGSEFLAPDERLSRLRTLAHLT